MDERKNRERGSKLDEYMQHDAEIRRATNVRNALGPVEEEQANESDREKERSRDTSGR